MNNNNSAATTTATATGPKVKKPGPGRFQGISVIASVLLPIAAAYIVFYTGLGMPEGTINQGELLQPPVNIHQMPFSVGGGGEPLRLGEEEPKWRYLILPGAGCSAECEKLLYTSRQVHIRLGEKADRVERLLVTASPLGDARQQVLHREHPRLRFAQLDEGALQQLRQRTAHRNITDPRALLVDQQGFAMMAYDNQHSGNQLLKDIKRLLKYSYDN